jgi:DNA-binding transcriptional LysR family regulator
MDYSARALRSFKQLETFYWAVKLGSFTAAAQRTHVCQSTVSMRIQELENTLGVKLFDRSARIIRLTPKGRDLVDYAERFIRLREELEQRIAAPQSLSGLVRLGVAEVVSVTWLPAFVQTVHRLHPGVSLILEQALTEQLLRGLRAGELDLVFAPGEPHEPGLISRPLGYVEFHWMASPRLNLPDEPLKPEVLATHPVISLSRESYHYANIDAWFRASDTGYRPKDTCTSIGVLAALVASGLGIGLLPPRCFRRELKETKLRIIHVQPAMRPVSFSAVVLSDAFEPVTRALIEVATEVSDFDKTPLNDEEVAFSNTSSTTPCELLPEIGPASAVRSRRGRASAVKK